MSLALDLIVAVCIGFRHEMTFIGDPDWLEGKVVGLPTQEELDEGTRIEGECLVEVPIDEVLHGRVVDPAGNFLIALPEKRAGKIRRWVMPADPTFVEHNTWRPDPRLAVEARRKALAERDSKVKEREDRLAEAKLKQAKAAAAMKATAAALSVDDEAKAAQAELDAALSADAPAAPKKKA